MLRRAAVVGVVGSLAIHVSWALWVVLTAIPSVDFELRFPIEVELGLTEATEVAVAPPAPPPEPVATESGASGTGPGAGLDAGVTSDAGLDGGVADAGRRRRRDAGADADVDAGIVAEEGTGAGGSGEDPAGSPVAFLPAGTQVALRIDLDRVRGSVLRAEVEELLASLPDWEALLEGSGIDPVRDLSRVLVATPNFDRSRLVVAGRLTDDAPDPREVVETMARAHGGGGPVEWEEQAGVPTARWASPDGAERRVALVGPRHFVIARPSDLPRVLAIAAARARDDEPVAADALLSMGEGEVLTVEVEGTRNLVGRSPCPVPLGGRFALGETADGVNVVVRGAFDDTAEAGAAERCYLRYVGLGRAIFPPLRPLLDRVESSVTEEHLDVTSSVTTDELRAILAEVSERFARRRPAAPDDPDPPPVAPEPAPEAPPPG